MARNARPVSITNVASSDYKSRLAPEPLAIVGFSDAVGATRTVSAASLNGRLAPAGSVDLNAITTDQPTITFSQSTTISGQVFSPRGENVTVLGCRGLQSGNGSFSVDGQLTGVEYIINSDMEIGWTERGVSTTKFVVLVDGLPTDLTPLSPGVTAAGAAWVMKISFAAWTKPRRITIYSSFMNQWNSIRTSANAMVSPTAPKPLVTFNGDSWYYGWQIGTYFGAVYGAALPLSRTLGVDGVVAALGGTGYVTAVGGETYSSPVRIARGLERGIPELIVHQGSSNDDAAVGSVYAAAYATYSAWAAAAPGVPQIVVGPPATSATATTSANRVAVNDEVRRAAADHPAVVGFINQLGITTSTVPAAYSGSTTYNGGDIVTHLGAFWQLMPGVTGTPAGTAPNASARWQNLAGGIFGTGNSGTPTGDGNRDVLLRSDGAHPELPYARSTAERVARGIRAYLIALAG